MATTFTKIATLTAGSGGQATFDFTAIPNTYKDLFIYLSTRTVSNSGVESAYVTMTFNSTNGSVSQELIGYAAATKEFRFDTTVQMPLGVGGGGSSVIANTFLCAKVYIPNYASSLLKTYLAVVTGTNTNTSNSYLIGTYGGRGLNAGTSAISSIQISRPSTSHAQYSTATLYGIKNS